MRKKQLEQLLERVRWPRAGRSRELEQYETPAGIAADMLWLAFSRGLVEGKRIVDLGSGSCRLAVGACLLGARDALAIDVDASLCKLCVENALRVGDVYGCLSPLNAAVPRVPLVRADLVLMNPPFGVVRRHMDVTFLRAAFAIADVVLSLHNADNVEFLKTVAAEYGFKAIHVARYRFPIPMMFERHRRRVYYTPVDLILFVRAGKGKQRT